MNFLAHFHLSHNNKQAVMGSLLGDFVKGSDYTQYAPDVARAIVLHRRIDSFTDLHEVVRISKNRLPNEYRRYGGIAVDLFYDHFLANHWQRYSQVPLAQFCGDIYAHLDPSDTDYPGNCRSVVHHMRLHDWLGSYADTHSIERALNGISRRLSRPTSLALLVDCLQDQYIDFEQDFLNFYPLVLAFAELEKNKLKKDPRFEL